MVPRRDLLLVVLSFSAGVVDAMSILALGVFTGAVTGDVVLLGVALGDADPHRAIRAALALGGFAAGVVLAVRALRAGGDARLRARRVPLVLAAVVLVQAAFFAGWTASGEEPEAAARALLVAAAALGMGAQTAAARALHPGGPPTTYITGTLTVLLSELATASGSRADVLRRVGIVVAIASGATAGSLALDDARTLVAALPPVLTALVAIAAAGLPPPPGPAVRPGR